MISYSQELMWIDHQSDQMISQLVTWANINSGSTHLKGIEEMQSSIVAAFTSLDCTIKKIPLAPRTVINSYGQPHERAQGSILLMQKHPQAPFQVLLGGHLDTVYPPESSFQKVEQIEKNIMRGPGVADMKGGLVILLTVLKALERSKYAGKIGWEVFINANEEIGSTGVDPILKECAERNSLALFFEPSFPDGALVNERKGSVNFTVVARGREAHAGRDFHLGRNAITALARFITEAEKLNNTIEGITLNVGHVEGGGAVNIVPALAICRINVRLTRPEQLSLICKALDSLVVQAHKKDGIALSLHEDTARPPKLFDEKHQSLFKAFCTYAKDLGEEIQMRSTGGACDGNILSAFGLPTIDSLGVIGGHLHTHDEYAVLSSLTQRAKLATYFLLKLAEKLHVTS